MSPEPVPDYLQGCVEAVCGLHASEPAGDVRVFLTGQDEVDEVVRRLQGVPNRPGRGGLRSRGLVRVEERVEVCSAASGVVKDPPTVCSFSISFAMEVCFLFASLMLRHESRGMGSKCDSLS